MEGLRPYGVSPTRPLTLVSSALSSRREFDVSRGVKQLGVRFGNWLSADGARRLWQSPDGETIKGKRDRAILAVLPGCGLRRRELADLAFGHLQEREAHWAIIDLIGKGGHIRTVPVPDRVKAAIDEWAAAADIGTGKVFRRVCRAGKHWGEGASLNAWFGTW